MIRAFPSGMDEDFLFRAGRRIASSLSRRRSDEHDRVVADMLPPSPLR